MMFYLGVWLLALLQEVVPFPSLLIFVPAGATLQAQHAGLWVVVVLAFAVGVARVLAGLLVYGLSEKLYAAMYSKRQSWLGLKRTKVNRVRKKLGESGGWWAVFTLWALPIVPSTLIPLSAGFVRIPLHTFITATYLGSIVSALSYMLIGYFGLQGLSWLGS
jgi:membrane protein DedA with SNARE-associated domain